MRKRHYYFKFQKTNCYKMYILQQMLIGVFQSTHPMYLYVGVLPLRCKGGPMIWDSKNYGQIGRIKINKVLLIIKKLYLAQDGPEL